MRHSRSVGQDDTFVYASPAAMEEKAQAVQSRINALHGQVSPGLVSLAGVSAGLVADIEKLTVDYRGWLKGRLLVSQDDADRVYAYAKRYAKLRKRLASEIGPDEVVAKPIAKPPRRVSWATAMDEVKEAATGYLIGAGILGALYLLFKARD